MSIDRFVESLRSQLRDLHARRAAGDLTVAQKGAITRDIRFIEKKLHLATRQKLTQP